VNRIAGQSVLAAERGAVQGDPGRNALRGFGATEVDLTLRRQFQLRERLSLQARADLFNLLNHPGRRSQKIEKKIPNALNRLQKWPQVGRNPRGSLQLKKEPLVRRDCGPRGDVCRSPTMGAKNPEHRHCNAS
jgi:hypothetical protein